MSNFSITIADQTFKSKKSLIKKLSHELNLRIPGCYITEQPLIAVLSVLFVVRASKRLELGSRKVTGWTIEANPKSKCFAAILDDESTLHFSFYKSVNAFGKEEA